MPETPEITHLWLHTLGAAGDAFELPMRFAKPGFLILVPILWALTWVLSRRSLAGFSTMRMALVLGVRCLAIALVCGALAEPSVIWRARDVAVVAVVDSSGSVPAEQRKLATSFLAASEANRPRQDRLGVVSVGREAKVESIPQAWSPPEELAAYVGEDASDLAKGATLARNVIPADAAGRVLLITDGNETNGSLAEAATNLSAAGVPVDVAVVEYDRTGEARVDNVVVPAWARDGDTIAARIILSAGKPTDGRLTVMLDGVAVDLDPSTPGNSAEVTLDAGTQMITQQLKLPAGPVHRVEAVFEPVDVRAGQPQLLRAEGVTFTSGRGRVLLLADDERTVAPWVQAVATEDVQVERRSGINAPVSLAEWAAYDAVILFDQPAAAFSQEQQADMAKYVKDAGGGLMMVGGPNGFGAGGWIGSPVADVLPVKLDPPSKRQMPMGALAIVIDSSGSMASGVSGTSMSQQQIANEAAILGIRALSRMDQVAVVNFAGEFDVAIPLTHADNPEWMARRIRCIGPGGGTNMFPALDAAGKQLEKSPAGVKHIIVLTDGETMGDHAEGLRIARRLKDKNITLSTVAIGDGANDELLRKLATTGGGRFHMVRSEYSKAQLPQIFIKEAQTVKRTLIWEGKPFSPTVGIPSDSMRGITGAMPAVSGYIVTTDREGFATVALRGMENDPILAHWQHGLGRVTAYTSDATTRWNAQWASWGQFNAFWKQQVRWLMRPMGDPNARIVVDQQGDTSKVMLSLLDAQGNDLNFAQVQGRLSSPDVGRESTPSQDVTFRQVGPGRYEATVDSRAVGSHLLALRYSARDDAGHVRSGSVRSAIVKRGGAEFSRATPDAELLKLVAARTGGRVFKLDDRGANLWHREHVKMPEVSKSIWLIVALAAMGVFLVDVGARRITIDWRAVRDRAQSLLRPGKAVATASAATLSTVKTRARAAHAERRDTGKPARVDVPEPAASDAVMPMADTVAQPRTSDVAAPIIDRANTPAKPGADKDDMLSRLHAARRRAQDDLDDQPPSAKR